MGGRELLHPLTATGARHNLAPRGGATDDRTLRRITAAPTFFIRLKAIPLSAEECEPEAAKDQHRAVKYRNFFHIMRRGTGGGVFDGVP
jgi:hypothetical protein